MSFFDCVGVKALVTCSRSVLWACLFLAGHLTYECRNFIRVDPNKELLLDISSTSSEESEEEVSISSTSSLTESTESEREREREQRRRRKKRREEQERSTSIVVQVIQ